MNTTNNQSYNEHTIHSKIVNYEGDISMDPLMIKQKYWEETKIEYKKSPQSPRKIIYREMGIQAN